MLKNIFYIGIAAILLASCSSAPKEHSACDCQKLMAEKDVEATKWCASKAKADTEFATEVAKCVAESMGIDTSKSEVSTGAVSGPSAGKYAVNLSKSKIKWTGRKVAGKHNGEVNVKSGNFNVDASGILTGGSIVMDMTSISVTDIEDAKSNGDLVGHLKADDFFGTANFPEASFVITKSELMEGGTKTNFKVEGDLTIKGITKPASAILMVVNSKNVAGNVSIAGGLKFDRTDYGIKYKSGKFFDSLGDKVINDEVTLQVTLVAS